MLKADAIEYAGETTRRPHEGLRSLRPFAALHLSCCEGQGEEPEGIVTPSWACGRTRGRITERMKKISYSGYRFPPDIIHQAIWLYFRFTLSLRDVEDLLAERGVAASYETVRRCRSRRRGASRL